MTRSALGFILAVLPAYAQLQLPQTGQFRFPPGRVELHSELRAPDGAHDLTLVGDRTLLVAAPDFQGRALLSLARAKRTQIRNLAFDGSRAALGKPLPLPKPNQPFSRFYQNNGILIEDSDQITVSGVTFTAIPNFAVLVYHSRHLDLSRISVARSGSLNARGRNNTSGGILLEEGVEDFTIADCELREIRGNGIWTHSYANSPHNLRGHITGNRFLEIGRDAIQLGHSDRVTVKGNSGWRIGLRFSEVDVEGGGTPVGIDTAGTVENCVYESNRFEEVNGKCIDLDGFHDGIVRANTCINRGKAEAYPYGNFGISLNNTSTRMTSRNVRIEANTLDGMKYGGIFLIGSGHTITHNVMTHLNSAHCNDSKAGCSALPGEPEFLESGIYLAKGAERPAPAVGNTIRDNTISGWKMAQHCIGAAPGVKLAENRIEGNRCLNE